MCTAINKVYISRKSIIVYKVIEERQGGELISIIYPYPWTLNKKRIFAFPHGDDMCKKYGKWEYNAFPTKYDHAKHYLKFIKEFYAYGSLFHCFKTKKDAMRYRKEIKKYYNISKTSELKIIKARIPVNVAVFEGSVPSSSVGYFVGNQSICSPQLIPLEII